MRDYKTVFTFFLKKFTQNMSNFILYELFFSDYTKKE